MNRSGNRFTTSNTSLEMLILWAYDIRKDRLFGKPKWLDSIKFDVVANAPAGPANTTPVIGQMRLMMQSLLAARFNLAAHRETKDLPLYDLVVAKTGPKVELTEAVAGPVSARNPFSMTGRGVLSGTRVSADMLAKVLSEQLGHAVEDRTGLKGVFDFTLQWAPDTDTQFDGAGPPTGASIFTAIQEQLGLKLEPRKGPVEVLVIDRVDNTPTGN
jgi:uncharacterized protein (TIGR03435 family)